MRVSRPRTPSQAAAEARRGWGGTWTRANSAHAWTGQAGLAFGLVLFFSSGPLLAGQALHSLTPSLNLKPPSVAGGPPTQGCGGHSGDPGQWPPRMRSREDFQPHAFNIQVAQRLACGRVPRGLRVAAPGYKVECFSKGTVRRRAAASSRNQQSFPVCGRTRAAGSGAPSRSSRMRCGERGGEAAGPAPRNSRGPHGCPKGASGNRPRLTPSPTLS
jgi:hypothetical protein